MSTEHDDAAEFVERTQQYQAPKKDSAIKPEETAAPKGKDKDEEELKHGEVCQYSEYGSGYRPAARTIKSLPVGCYDICADTNGVFVAPTLPPTGLLLELPEMRSEHVVGLVESFWRSEKDYKEGNEFVHGGAAYKAGIMIYGPPGSGKSCTIKIVCKRLLERGGTVFYADTNPSIVNAFLADFSRVEKNRKCIVILEDFDTLLHKFSEDQYLQMLDSAKSIDNVLFIATTNYPERLDPRIYNRPGRFSHVVKIGLPTPAARKAFLEAILKSHRDVPTIVEKSDGFSIDHLSALVNAVYREKKSLLDEIERLRKLFKVPVADERKGLGLGAQ